MNYGPYQYSKDIDFVAVKNLAAHCFICTEEIITEPHAFVNADDNELKATGYVPVCIPCLLQLYEDDEENYREEDV